LAIALKQLDAKFNIVAPDVLMYDAPVIAMLGAALIVTGKV
jgi:hypothetical protein